MFRNLEAERTRRNMTQHQLAEALEMSPSTLSLKMNERYGFTLKEAVQIKKILGVDIPLEILFQSSA